MENASQAVYAIRDQITSQNTNLRFLIKNIHSRSLLCIDNDVVLQSDHRVKYELLISKVKLKSEWSVRVICRLKCE